MPEHFGICRLVSRTDSNAGGGPHRGRANSKILKGRLELSSRNGVRNVLTTVPKANEGMNHHRSPTSEPDWVPASV